MTTRTSAMPDMIQEILPVSRAQQQRSSIWLHLRRIGLVGSVMEGEARANSDVYVRLELEPLTPFAIVDLKQKLEDLRQRSRHPVRLHERKNSSLREVTLQDSVTT